MTETAKCNNCGYEGHVDTFDACISIYHDLRCPKCSTTDVDTTALNAATMPASPRPESEGKMSFETWWKGRYQDGPIYFSDVQFAWNASRAEAEAALQAPMKCGHPKTCEVVMEADAYEVIHACKWCRSESLAVLKTIKSSEEKIARLQSERDALRDALAGVGAAHLNAPLLSGCLCDWCKVTRELLSTPARREPVGCFLVNCRIIGPHRHDGEPARKP